MTRNTKILGASVVALSLAVASAAGAATFIKPWTTSSNGDISVTIGDDGLGNMGGSTDAKNGDSTHAFTGNASTTGTFTDTFNFFLPTGRAGASVITTISGVPTNDLTFSTISFNGATGTVTPDGSVAKVSFQNITQGGPQELVITGNGASAATWGGTVSFLVNGAVPESSTWALMIVGFGGAGAMLRRRRAMQFA